ncbi:hypothetical protein PHMEG_00010760 [Phytophthora megakarya]|uniref:Uncharacterized protein n=1 Tax=Phytophthora megakarya TaxID=4795 RepID=A0A225WFD0_9STRA|nr:hypothetical protein PHMEG_00010760 [Phytophthora megakarya]
MITRGQEPTDAPASTSPRITTAPSGRRKQRALTSSTKRAASKPLSGGTLNEARKGKKKAAKRASPAPTPTDPEKNADRGPAVNVGSELEEKAPPRAAKKPKKATTATELGAASREDGFDLSEFMASFQPETASVIAPPVTAGPLRHIQLSLKHQMLSMSFALSRKKSFVYVVLSARKSRRPGTP